MPFATLACLAGIFGALWLGCSLAMLKNSSLKSWLRYFDAALILPGILLLLSLNLKMSWHVTPWLVELTGALSDAEGVVAAPLAFLVCAPLPVGAFIWWRRSILRLDRELKRRHAA